MRNEKITKLIYFTTNSSLYSLKDLKLERKKYFYIINSFSTILECT